VIVRLTVTPGAAEAEQHTGKNKNYVSLEFGRRALLVTALPYIGFVMVIV